VREDDSVPKQSVFDRSLIGGLRAGGNIEGVSFSGNERNNLFLNLSANSFEDISGVSGIDHPADGRALGLIDYDRDGWSDLVIVNANSPLLQLYRNGAKEVVGERPVLAVRLVGGNRTASPADGFASRDGYGASVEVDVEGVKLVREHRAGEGLATQSSATLLIGLGPGAKGGAVRVRWPSGQVQELPFAAADSLVTVYEDASESQNGSGFSLAPYRVAGLAARAAAAPSSELDVRRLDIAGQTDKKHIRGRFKLLTTMATWCDACKAELPQIKLLRAEFGADELEIFGVPVDENDNARKLEEYVKTYAPAYEMLAGLSDEQVAAVKQAVIDTLRIDALPAAILTDSDGHVLRTIWGVPSVSDVRELLAREDA
jgi:thiol-disulfide isomerase/thioredoxin